MRHKVYPTVLIFSAEDQNDKEDELSSGNHDSEYHLNISLRKVQFSLHDL